METLKNELPIIDTRSLVDKVEVTLIDLLIKRKLEPGDLIPKEMDLAKVMGVSRTVVRESLNRLKTIGLIESIKHKGTVIKSPDLFELFKKSMIPRVLNEATLRDIFELRMVLEIGMGDLIFLRKTPKDIEELYEIVEIEPAYTDAVLFDIEHEVRFHGKLYAITGNQTMMNFQSLLLPAFNYVYDSGLIKRPLKKTQYVSHKQLVDIINGGSPDHFRIAMRQHLENHFQRLFE